MAPTKLKIKGNKAFSLLSIETDEDLSKTWRLMTKVKDALEYGMRLENLAWRLWFMHHQMVHDPKSQTHFKKLSSATTKKLENEKANNIKDLAAPLYRPPKPQELKGKKKLPKKNATSANASNAGSQTRKKNAKNVKPVAEPVSVEVATSSTSTNNVNDNNNAETNDHSQTDYGNNNNKIITTVNEQNNAELMELDSLDENMGLHGIGDMFRFSDVNQEFYLRQYTNDQDPYQVISLPGLFTRFDAHAILNPNNSQPTMMLELNDIMMRNQFYSSPDSSEPTSPDEEWFSRQSSELHPNLQYHQLVGRTSSAGLLHDAVYVRNDVVTGLTLSTSHDAHTPLNTPLNTPTTTNGNILSSSNAMYMNQYSEQNTNNSLGQHQQQSQGSKSTITSPTSSQSSIDVSVAGRPSNNNTPSASASSASENIKPKKAHSNGEQQCFNCGVTSTPLWRRSSNDELLCNACGLYLKLHKMSRPKTMKPHIVRKDARDDESTQPVCSNCGTMTTPLWRRDEEGQTLCNACGLYFKLHHERRPLSMKTDVIKKRQRYENGQTPNRRGGKKQRANELDQQESQEQQTPAPPPPSQPPQSQQAQAMFSESNGSMPVPTTMGSVSVGQSPTSGMAVCQSPTTATSVNGGYQ